MGQLKYNDANNIHQEYVDLADMLTSPPMTREMIMLANIAASLERLNTNIENFLTATDSPSAKEGGVDLAANATLPSVPQRKKAVKKKSRRG